MLVESRQIGLGHHDKKTKRKYLSAMGMATQHQIASLIFDGFDSLGLMGQHNAGAFRVCVLVRLVHIVGKNAQTLTRNIIDADQIEAFGLIADEYRFI